MVMVAQMTVTVLKQANLIDGNVTDVVLTDGLISAVGVGESHADEATVVDLTGYLLLPAAVEPHAHLDKAFLAETIVNPTGDLCEGGTFYMDAPLGGTARMEMNLLDLMDHIDATYRTKRPSAATITH